MQLRGYCMRFGTIALAALLAQTTVTGCSQGGDEPEQSGPADPAISEAPASATDEAPHATPEDIAELERATAALKAEQARQDEAYAEAQKVAALALSDYNASVSSRCVAGDYYEHISDSIVVCGCGYDYYQHSRDGTNVCTGGMYDYYQHSRDGSTVSCGGQYDYYQHSRDGHRVCAGWKYDYYQHSRDGKTVVCGGQYDYYQTSRDGSMTCYGGRYKR